MKPVGADQHRSCRRPPLDAQAGAGAKSCEWAKGQIPGLRGATDCRRRRDVPTAPRRRRQAAEARSSFVAVASRRRSVSAGRPSVSVPVLSSATTCTSRRICSASPLRNSTPSSAAAPGADHDRGRRGQPHGAGAGDDQHRHRGDQREGERRLGAEDQPDEKVSAAMAITPARTAVIRSTSDWIGSLAPCACSTMRMIWASVVSAPTRVARQRRAPVLLTVPPVTLGARRLRDRDRLAGDHDLVDIGLAREHPPSVGNALAGAHQHDVAGARSRRAVDLSAAPSRSTRAVFGWSRISARIAAPVRPLARASISGRTGSA